MRGIQIWRNKTLATYGYITRKKKQYTVKVLGYLFIAISIYCVGLLVNKMDSKNLFSVLAMLMVLPGAKALVEWIAFFPFHSMGREKYERLYKKLQSIIPECEPLEKLEDSTVLVEGKLNWYVDIVFSSSEKIMNLDSMLITEHYMLGLLGKEKQERNEIEQYLQDGLEHRMLHQKVIICESEKEYVQFFYRLKDEVRLEKCKEREEVVTFFHSLVIV